MSLRQSNSITGSVVTKALGILLIVCLAECAAGSCLSYGHSCWGAHGKRSSSTYTLRGRNEGVIPIDDRWYFLKLFRGDAKHPPLDVTNDNEIFRRRLDGSDEKKEFTIGKPISSEYSEEDMQEKSPLEVIMEDTRPADKLNLLQILKDNTATYP